MFPREFKPIFIENNELVTCKLNLRNCEIMIHLVDTGNDTMTGGRIKRLSNYLTDGRFMVTYGDGIADVNLYELEKFHISHGKIATITAVQPPARFGGLELDGDKVLSFREKSILDQSWINGGFFVLKSKVFDYIENSNTLWEKEPLESLASQGELKAYKHEKFWIAMDTIRDKLILENLIKKNFF